MKRSISLLSALAFVLVFSGSVFGQDNITASATITDALVFQTNSQLNFGSISNNQTTDAVIDPNGSNSGVEGSATFGEIEITGTAGNSIDITFTNPGNLSDGSGNTIAFAANHTGHTSDDPANSSDLTTSETGIALNASTGKYFIYYGGTLTGSDIDAAPTGTYEGTIQTTISYN